MDRSSYAGKNFWKPTPRDSHRGWIRKARLSSNFAYVSIIIFTWATLLVGAIVFAKGGFDRQLVSAGMNVNDCAVTGLGAVVCGQEAEMVEQIRDSQGLETPSYYE